LNFITGGKHSDLDTIGKDDYHHTFFEMLGNWSFGTYGKEKACILALNLLVNVYKLDMSKLYFTYFDGNGSLNLQPDLETKLIWSRLGVPERQILGFGVGENFWEMDATGPCGPCTEIHYNRTDERSDEMAKLVNRGDERVIELWNLVFMQYNRLSEKTFIDLPQMVVDTGCGLGNLKKKILNDCQSSTTGNQYIC
jgi:alanyl-tRNA synthetase